MKCNHRIEGLLAAVAATGLLLTGCNNGSDGDAMPPPTPGPTEAVPPDASTSSAGLVKYLSDLAAAAADDKEPVDLSGFAPQTPDDTEPEPVG